MGRSSSVYGGVVQKDYKTEVAAGRVHGKTIIHKYGRNPDLDVVDVFETLWNGGGLYTGFDAVEAQTVTITSTSDNDTLAGTGARTITLYGLDFAYLPLIKTYNMNGSAGTITTDEFLRCDRSRVESAGTTGANEGTINVTQTTSGIKFAGMPIGYNSTMIAAYTIPAGKTGYLDTLFSTFSGGKKAAYASLQFRVRLYNGIFVVQGEAALHSEGSSNIFRKYDYPVALPEKADLHIVANTSSANVGVSAAFDILLEDNL